MLPEPAVNFNLYLDDKTAKEVDRTAKKLGETRSGLIRKAVREWLDKKTSAVPAGRCKSSNGGRARGAALRSLARRTVAAAATTRCREVPDRTPACSPISCAGSQR